MSASAVCKVAPSDKWGGEVAAVLFEWWGDAKSSSHMPELGNVSRKACRQVLLGKLSWLLCQRVQSSQVRAELLHSQWGPCCKF